MLSDEVRSDASAIEGKEAPLTGVKVLELARILAGPWAGQTLADLGAEVHKLEAPQGDDTRRWGPPFCSDGSAAYFHGTNRGKTSEVVDFRTSEGQARTRALAAEADVVIENFKVGGLAKYGLDYAGLRSVNPGLIYCSITGFGQDGPYAHRAGYDFIIQAMSGLMSFTGEPGGQPMKTGVAITDLVTGLYAVSAILAALHQRVRTGIGQHIDMSLLDCAVAVTANQAMNYLVTGDAPGRLGNHHPNLSPYQVFACADGHLIIAVGNDGQFERLCALLDVPLQTRFATNADRVAHRDALDTLLSDAMTGWSQADLLTACEANGVPAGPINDMEAVFSDPQIVARALQIDAEGVPGVRSPFRFSDATLALGRGAPQLARKD